MPSAHPNLCEHAEDLPSLYRIWDEDLRRSSRRRQISESVGMLCLVGSLTAWSAGFSRYLSLGLILMGAIGLYAAIKFMIDESNTNYLMHQWDLKDALARMESQRRLNRQV